ncbi:hypothetical protein LCGC14_0570800 [marine sediment metagenome]|uniref:Polysaccharide biosynthesis protein C-terminal domain-containing protein n=1 Tax=marine sediment metagenome TaxID=412755 RepID=A0A0F9USF4_9ZZZZ
MKLINNLRKSAVFTNSAWGIGSSVVQNIFLSLHFIIIARSYSTFDFAQFLLATSLYQFISAISSLGLGQWFVREYMGHQNKNSLTSKFLKIQIVSGLVFYALNILFVLLFYDDKLLQNLAIILGLNVIFDNLIYAIKNLNIAEFQQKKTFRILIIDSVIRLFITIILLIYPFSIITLSILVILSRFLTLNLFISIGLPQELTILLITKARVTYSDFKTIIYTNWSFIIIGSISIIYWRISTIIISKFLDDRAIADYEISFKIFLIAQLVPLILSSTIFPSFVNHFKNFDEKKFKKFYTGTYLLYSVFGLLAFTFIYSFSELIIPFAFGETYQGTYKFTIEMFLTILVFPTALLQANALIALKMERKDMLINIVSFLFYLLFCFTGLYFEKSLSVVNLSIFISWIIFHLIQNYFLIKRSIVTLRFALVGYLSTILLILGYTSASGYLNKYFVFALFWLSLGIFVLFNFKKLKKNIF